jgi:hypothetical protein
MLSVTSTLRETFWLWAQKFWVVLAISLVTGIPKVLLDGSSALIKSLKLLDGSHPTGLALAAFGALLLSPLCSVLNSAAILGLLAKSEQITAWFAIRNSIEANTWTLYRLFWLLALIVVLLFLPFVWLVRLFGSAKIITLFVVGLYLIFIKYALADPLVVAENMGAVAALKRSWKMTKDHFWYVAGCYLFLGLSNWLIGWMLKWMVTSPFNVGGYRMLAADQLVALCLHLIQPMWIISAWCMYREIKALDYETPVDQGQSDAFCPNQNPSS